MLRSTALLLAVLLTFALPAYAAQVHCGDVLTGSGTTYVLDTDLVCTQAALGQAAPASPVTAGLTLGEAATLDLNGHTFWCGPGIQHGIRMTGGHLRNGTVANCPVGVGMIGKGIVENMVFAHNEFGLFVQGRGHSLFINNTATENGTGFVFEDTATDNVLLNNTATYNVGGFALDGGEHNTLIGNTATFNRGVGFATGGEQDLRVLGNLAEANGSGFDISDNRRSEYSGNTAQYNAREGFSLSGNTRLQLHDNIARANGGDGFQIQTSLLQNQVVTNNYAIANGGNGIHVFTQLGPLIRIVGNTALQHMAPYFDLADDNLHCRGQVWSKNTFDTKSQACIK